MTRTHLRARYGTACGVDGYGVYDHARVDCLRCRASCAWTATVPDPEPPLPPRESAPARRLRAVRLVVAVAGPVTVREVAEAVGLTERRVRQMLQAAEWARRVPGSNPPAWVLA